MVIRKHSIYKWKFKKQSGDKIFIIIYTHVINLTVWYYIASNEYVLRLFRSTTDITELDFIPGYVRADEKLKPISVHTL